MICPVRLDERQQWRKVLLTVAMSLHGGTKGVCRHVSTPTLKSVMELRKSL